MSSWPDAEQILGAFRQWLEQTRAEVEAVGEDGPLAEALGDAQPIGLFQLVEAITALRHEVKLGTKSARSLEEQATAAVAGLHQAIQQFRSVEAKEQEAARRAARPFVEAVIDLDEALRRGQAVIEKARHKLLEELLPRSLEELEKAHRRQGWFRRWWTRPAFQLAQKTLRQQIERMRDEMLDPLLAGYQLIVNRLHRVMKDQEIYRMECVGKPVDPNAMTVVDVVEDPSRPPGLVVEEVRAGYYWKAQPVRFAEVRAIRGEPTS